LLEIDPKKFPTLPGVYLMQGEAGEILYVGKAKNLRSRLRSYF
jgi:excinuclease ABC subunit C